MNAHAETNDAVVVQPLSEPLPLTFTMGRNTGKTQTVDELMQLVASDERRMETPVEDFFTGFYRHMRGTLLGYMGEARPRKQTFIWQPEISIIGRKKHWLYPTYVHPIDGWKNGAMRFRVPARRRAGFGAYKKLKQLESFKAPQPTDCAWDVFREEVRIRYDHYPPGTLITIAYDGMRWVDPYKERASQRRARLSSTTRYSTPVSK